ncbi:uncharacterized protein LOC128992237 [Macrosteles quadrilineatus]|uniref:uncharacterized protein LOC128992237 n=1 Tax=Macrosteles quadrilineatus TaxID=74068 RepID=UPI0023E1E554|nr:uncharacterized protein LOC128992237 [Macrosteles quadrilineatus]
MDLILWFSMVFGPFLIHQSLAFGFGSSVNGHVMFCPKQIERFDGLMQHYTAIKPEDNMKDRLMQDTISFGDKNLVVKCIQDNDEATVYIYAPEGYLVDRVKMRFSKNVCNNVKDRISLRQNPLEFKDKEELLFTLVYTFGEGWDAVCISRFYMLTTFENYYAKLERHRPERQDCGDKIVTGDANINCAKEEMLPTGEYEIMDLVTDADPVGEPSLKTLKANSNLKLKCQKYFKKEKTTDGSIQSTPIAIGYITYEGLILEKLFLDSCPDEVEGMYINRLPEPIPNKHLLDTFLIRDNEFILVFKTKKGSCFKIFIGYRLSPCKDTASILRFDHHKVSCPQDWTSDAALDVNRSWF